ncbi:carboxymuconolactone decarboxylase family protein [Streptomyces lavendulae]|uniref:carboxymuconolactone decarboxylase family protein n=1 Tax=Streptomyces lavendulae TaxID=1914 RepID=UPI0037F92229
MTARLNLFSNPPTTTAKAAGYFGKASKTIREESTLPTATQKLVVLRASQINGCGYATDVWSKNAAHAGESATRINLVAAWRESTVIAPRCPQF